MPDEPDGFYLGLGGSARRAPVSVFAVTLDGVAADIRRPGWRGCGMIGLSRRVWAESADMAGRRRRQRSSPTAATIGSPRV